MGQQLTSACEMSEADHTRLGWTDELQPGMRQWRDCTLRNVSVTRIWIQLLEDGRKWLNISTCGWVGGWAHSTLCVDGMRPTSQSSGEGLSGTEGTFSSARLDCMSQHEGRLLQERQGWRGRPHTNTKRKMTLCWHFPDGFLLLWLLTVRGQWTLYKEGLIGSKRLMFEGCLELMFRRLNKLLRANLIVAALEQKSNCLDKIIHQQTTK